MPTEDDLRIGYRALERHTPDVADVLRAVYDHPGERPARGGCRPACRGGTSGGPAWPWAPPGR